MAEAVGAAVYYIGGVLGSSAATASVGAALMTYSTAIGYGIAIAGTVAMASHQQSRARRKARDAYNSSLSDRMLTVRSAIAPSRIVLGRCRVGSQMAYIASTGQHLGKLVMVLALAGHEIDAVEQVYFNDSPVTLDAKGYVLDSAWRKADRANGLAHVDLVDGRGSVVLPHEPIADSTYVSTERGTVSFTVSGNVLSVNDPTGFTGLALVNYQYSEGPPRARVIAHLGAPGQAVDPLIQSLLPTAWTAEHRGEGVAYLAVVLEYDADVFQSGIPSVTAVVRGAKCYDPRTGTTAWTENPALLLRHYAGSPLGGRMTAAQLAASDAQIIAAANVCDTPVTYTVDGVPQDGPLYTAGLMATTEQQPWEVMQQIAEAMAGRLAFAGNRLLVRAGAYVAPVLSLTDDDFAGGGISVQPRMPREQLFNVVTGRTTSSTADWQVVDMPRVEAGAWITDDGAELVTDVEYAAVTSTWRAQQLAAVALRRVRQGLTITAAFKLSAYQVELFDTVSLTCTRYGWVEKVFEVLGRRWTLDGGIELTLRETDPSVYAVGLSFDAADPAPNTLLPGPWSVPDVGPLTVTSGTEALTDDSIITRTRVQWPAVLDEGVRAGGRIEVQYAVSGQVTGLDWATVTESGDATETVITGLLSGFGYFFRARASNSVTRGRWSLQAWHEISAPPIAPAIVGLLSADAVVLPADAAGVVGSYGGAVTTMRVISSGLDDTANWSISRADGLGVSSALAGATVTVLGLSSEVDSSWVDLTAAREGFASITKRFAISKARQGVQGDKGDKGDKGDRGDGGAPGLRGNVQLARAIGGTAWSDAEANAAIADNGSGVPIAGDMVTLHNSAAGYSEARVYAVGAWRVLSAYFSGSLLVDDSVVARKINGYDLRVLAGAYTGYAWPAPGQGGFYLGPEGLLLGNANNGRYFQVTNDGQVYAPGLSIVDGVARLGVGAYLGTLQVQDVESQNGAQQRADAAQAAAVSTAAADATSKAAAGVAAYSAVTDATTGLGARLSAYARSALAGNGGVVAGTLVWDSNGNRLSGYGTAMTVAGIVCYRSDGTPMVVLGNDGSATFGGALNAATGTFAGVLTADAVGAVNTINLAGESVTVPRAAYTAARLAVATNTQAQSVAIDTHGQRVTLQFGCSTDMQNVMAGATINFSFVLKRDGVTLQTWLHSVAEGGAVTTATMPPYVDQPAAGSHTYSVECTATGLGGSPGISSRGLLAMEVQR